MKPQFSTTQNYRKQPNVGLHRLISPRGTDGGRDENAKARGEREEGFAERTETWTGIHPRNPGPTRRTGTKRAGGRPAAPGQKEADTQPESRNRPRWTFLSSRPRNTPIFHCTMQTWWTRKSAPRLWPNHVAPFPRLRCRARAGPSRNLFTVGADHRRTSPDRDSTVPSTHWQNCHCHRPEAAEWYALKTGWFYRKQERLHTGQLFNWTSLCSVYLAPNSWAAHHRAGALRAASARRTFPVSREWGRPPSQFSLRPPLLARSLPSPQASCCAAQLPKRLSPLETVGRTVVVSATRGKRLLPSLDWTPRAAESA